MEPRKELLGLVCLLLINPLSSTQCEGRSLRQSKKGYYHHNVHAVKHEKSPQMKTLNQLDTHYAASDPYYFVASPFSLPPYGAVMGPSSSPQDYPPFCVYPPFTPLPPSNTPTSPILFPEPPPPPLESTNPSPVVTPSPPEYPVPSPPAYIPGPPETVPSPPEAVPNPPAAVPSPPQAVPSPPAYEPSPPIYVPSPTGFVPSPTGFVPSPTGFVPSPTGFVPSPPPPPSFVPNPPVFVPGPPIFLPPVVYPPPLGPPPPAGVGRDLWCVAKPTVPDPIIQEAMNYACGSGADCDSIQPNGSCYQPDTLIAHASFAFNSYWQRTKIAGGTCDFGGTAMLVTKDPSYDGCHFIIY